MGTPKEYCEKLEKENRLLREIIDHLHESVFVTDHTGKIVLYNTENERIDGMTREEVLGKKEKEVYPDYTWAEDVTRKIVADSQPIIEKSYRYTVPDGRDNHIIFSAFPHHENGRVTHVYTIARCLNQISKFISTTLEQQNRLLLAEAEKRMDSRFFLEDIIGKSPGIKATVKMARKAAAKDSNILITGETGTGKELFAQGIHYASRFSNGIFVPINCASIPDTLLESVLFGARKGSFTGATDRPGLFEKAENGTIFLDEINSMPMHLQAKILRVIQDRKVRRLGSNQQIPIRCRIISAMNEDPHRAMELKKIRPDLFYRLSVVTLTVPPLRDRPEDIKALSKLFINRYNLRFGLFVSRISGQLHRLFQDYSWPGNVRELENIIESIMTLLGRGTKVLMREHLPACHEKQLAENAYKQQLLNLNPENLGTFLADMEKRKISQVLKKNRGNVTQSASQLGISRQNLHYKIRTLKIKKPD